MGVFAIAANATLFREAAVAAAYELGLFEPLAIQAHTVDELAEAVGIATGKHRVRALVDALVETGALVRVGEAVACGDLPERPEVVREGWGRLAEVMRADRPLSLGADPTAFHHHLLRAGADSAREVARLVTGTKLLDLGGGAGTYTAAFLDARPAATATLVDFADAIALARVHLAPFGDRVRFVIGDARDVALDEDHDVVLLANLLHLHGPTACAELCAAAARAVAPGGTVAIVELRADSLEGLWFALDMALYTERGDVYPTSAIHGWLAAAGLIELVEDRLAAAPENVVVVGRRPRGAGRRFAEHTGFAEPAEQIAAELGALAMAKSVGVIEVERRDELTMTGVDVVSFLLVPHPGAEPRPLSRGASGGELSRVMLAIEVVIATVDPVPTFIFDEVDAGVGGAAAIEVGRRLAMLARTSQVIVVTHLAQVAAFADHHLRVAKDSSGEITASSVDLLVGDARTAEMARLLSGMPDSESALAHARELVESARQSVV